MANKLIWVDEAFAGKLEIVNDIVRIKSNGDIDKIIKSLADDTETMTECLDENVLKFKLHAKQVRDNYKKVVQEELDQSYKLWEECDKLRSDANKKLTDVQKTIGSIKDDVSSIRKSVESINVYGVDRILELVKKFENMSENERELLCKLLNN